MNNCIKSCSIAVCIAAFILIRPYESSAQTSDASPVPTPAPIGQDNNPTAVIQRADGSTMSVQSASKQFPLVAADASSGVNVQLRFPNTSTGSPLIAQPLDGGAITDQTAAFADDGSASLCVQFAAAPGLYRIQVNGGSTAVTLQFWIADPAQPNPGPPTL